MHPICPPHYGESGPAYTRVFKTNFVANLWDQVDEGGWSLAEHILGLDEALPGQPHRRCRRLPSVRTGAGWRARGVVEVVSEASALAAALERRAEPHQHPDGHEPAQGAPHAPWLAKRDGACAPTLGGGRG